MNSSNKRKNCGGERLNECLILIGFSLSTASSLLPAISDSINTVDSESFLEYNIMTEYCFRSLALTKRQTIEVHCLFCSKN